MKKLFCSFLIIFLFVGCGKKEESTKGFDFQLNSAKTVVNNYFKYVALKDKNNAKLLLSEDLAKEVEFDNNLFLWGYKFDEITQIGNTGLLKVSAVESSYDKTYSALSHYKIKVEKIKGDYKITEINNKLSREVFKVESMIRLKKEEEVETNLLLNKSSIPKYARSKDMEAKTYNMEVSLYNFGPISLSYSGEMAVFSTINGKDTYYALTFIDYSEPTSESQGGDKSESDSRGRDFIEKPIGKKIVPLDYLVGSKILFETFSLDEKYVIIGYKKEVGSSIRLYYTLSGNIIPVKLENIFPLDKYDISYSSCDKESIYFHVSTISGEIDNMVGKYKMDLKDFNILRI